LYGRFLRIRIEETTGAAFDPFANIERLVKLTGA
jgi:hypothetical protein